MAGNLPVSKFFIGRLFWYNVKQLDDSALQALCDKTLVSAEKQGAEKPHKGKSAK